MNESWKTLERFYGVTEPLANPKRRGGVPRGAVRRSQHAAGHRRAAQGGELELAGGLGLLGFSNTQMRIEARKEVDTLRSPRPSKRAKPRARRRTSRKSDRIRDELLAKGIVLKDGPGGTTWEVKR